MAERKLIKRSELPVIFGIAAVAAVLMLASKPAASGGNVCRVMYDGSTVKTVDLAEDGMFRIPEAPRMEFEVKDGKIAAAYSDCPDKICVRTGFIGSSGQKIVCLPNRIVVSVDASEPGRTDPDEPDMIAG